MEDHISGTGWGGRRNGAGRKSNAVRASAEQLREFRQLCRDNAPEAMERLMKIIRSPTSQDIDAIHAAREIFSRAYGQATQPITLADDAPRPVVYATIKDFVLSLEREQIPAQRLIEHQHVDEDAAEQGNGRSTT